MHDKRYKIIIHLPTRYARVSKHLFYAAHVWNITAHFLERQRFRNLQMLSPNGNEHHLKTLRRDTDDVE